MTILLSKNAKKHHFAHFPQNLFSPILLILTKNHCAKFKRKPKERVPSNTGFRRMHGQG